MSEWISVEDRLPELNIEVKIKGEDWTDFTTTSLRKPYKVIKNKKLAHTQRKGRTWRWVITGKGKFDFKDFTHWQPLPTDSTPEQGGSVTCKECGSLKNGSLAEYLNDLQSQLQEAKQNNKYLQNRINEVHSLLDKGQIAMVSSVNEAKQKHRDDLEAIREYYDLHDTDIDGLLALIEFKLKSLQDKT